MQAQRADRCPDGTAILSSVRVYASDDGRFLTITYCPSQDTDDELGEHQHNCDAVGCGQDHVLARVEVPEWQRPALAMEIRRALPPAQPPPRQPAPRRLDRALVDGVPVVSLAWLAAAPTEDQS